MKKKRNQRSFVFMTAILLVSVLVVAVWEFSYVVSQNLRLSYNMVKEVQALSIARAAFRGSLAILKMDNESVDGNHDEWRKMMPPMIPLGPGNARLKVDAEDGKINVNFLINEYDDEINTTIFSYLRELFIILGYESNSLYALADYIDSNDTPLSHGGERDYYAELKPPLIIKNSKLDSIYEMGVVKGFTSQMLIGDEVINQNIIINEKKFEYPTGLLHYLTVYGDYAKDKNQKTKNYATLNINFIPVMLLKAMDADLTNYSIEQIVLAREKGNFTVKEVDDKMFMMTQYALSGNTYDYLFGKEDGEPRIGVRSKFFRIRGVGEVDNITKVVESVVKRENRQFKILYYTEK